MLPLPVYLSRDRPDHGKLQGVARRRSGVWVKIGDSAGSLLGGFLALSIPGWWFGTFFPYIGNPNWRTPSFFRGVGIPPTSSFFQSTHVWQGKKIDPYPGNVKRGLFLRLLYQSLVSVVIVIDHCLGYPRIPSINQSAESIDPALTLDVTVKSMCFHWNQLVMGSKKNPWSGCH